MADQECSIDDIPPQYQEIFCSLNDTTGDNYRAFVCKDGSMVGTDKYIIKT